jgi:hypothetical protein
MTADPWAGKFCCQVETLYGDVDLGAVTSVGRAWAEACFAPGHQPAVRWMVATGDFDVLPLTDAVHDALDAGELTLTRDGFRESAIADFVRRGDRPDADGAFDHATVHVVIGARHVRVVYSHLFGDETVFFPKVRRLSLAIGGRTLPIPPPLTDERALTGLRLLGAAAQVAASRPRAVATAARTIVRGRSTDAVMSPSSVTRPADPNAVFAICVTIETVSAPKIPSVLLYCSILRDLALPAGVMNHVIADLRSYSPALSGTGGNAVSHVPFVADWSRDDPSGCAASIAARLRVAEPVVRAAASRLFGLGARMTTSRPSVSSATLATSMSYYRVPAGQSVVRSDGDAVHVTGLQTPDLGVLAFNARDFGGTADLTVSHRGGLVDRDRVLAALVVNAARVGCRVTWSWSFDRRDHASSSSPITAVPTEGSYA